MEILFHRFCLVGNAGNEWKLKKKTEVVINGKDTIYIDI